MDIKNVVNYEKLFDLSIVNPITDEPIGLEMKIRSAGSEVCKKIYRKHAEDVLDLRLKGKRPKARQGEKEELERTAACIADWEWTGDADFRGEKPELTMKVAVEILDQVPWIYQQVKGASENIENFSGNSEPKS